MIKTRALLATLMIAVLFLGGFWAKKSQDNSILAAQRIKEAAAVDNLKKEFEEKELRTKQQQENFKRTIDSYVQQFDGEYSVYVNDVNQNFVYVYQNKPMPSASMIKVFILAKAYEEINKGTLAESEIHTLRRDEIVGGAGNIQGKPVGSQLSIKYLLEQMIVESDNIATNIMIERLGMDNINNYIQQHGYKDTRLQRRMMDFAAQQQGRENYTSVNDLGNIFLQMYKHTCVNEAMDEKMLDILKGQTDNDKIPQGLPQGTEVAHKTGELPGVYNDGGIIYTKQGDYLLVVLANKVGGEAIGNIADLSRKVYDGLFAKPLATALASGPVLKPAMVEKSIEWGAKRSRLIHEYARMHYGKDIDTIVPQMIVLHWTAAGNWEGTYNFFYPAVSASLKNGKLNVGSHYLVARDGTIFQLTPEDALNRHIIGYNWCAIGVENVGGVNGLEDLTQEQVQANIALIRYLSEKYSTIKYVIGHYQQEQARSTGLYIEKVNGYYSLKIDPGPLFMGKVHKALQDTDLVFFKE